MYIIFTNDIPDLAHDHNVSYKDQQAACQSCGRTVFYVDDGTYSYGCFDPVELSSITLLYNKISKYIVSKKLVINDHKTHLVVMAKKGQEAARETVTLQAGAHNIQPVQTVKSHLRTS